MKMTIYKDDLDVVKGKPNEFVTEASTVGFAPGLWPEVVDIFDEIPEAPSNTWPKYTFFLQGVTMHDGDVLLATYTTLGAQYILTVLND